MKKTAIVSVTNKEKLDVLLNFLKVGNFTNIIASGKTYEVLDVLIKKMKIPISLQLASEVTGFPEILDGRIKTIHPKIEGSILWDRKNPRHLAAAKKFDLLDIACVVCNFYQINDEDSLSEADLRERIDIGGPALVLSGIKNWPYVIVLTNPNQYESAYKEYKELGDLSIQSRKRLASIAMDEIAKNRQGLSNSLAKRWVGENKITFSYTKGIELGRYGENWHQKAWLYSDENSKESNVVNGKQVFGPQLGYNNYIDMQSALALVKDTENPSCVVIKHNNPCGYATGKNLVVALERAWQGDPVSAYGCVLGFNRLVDKSVMEVICDRENFSGKTGWFVEAIIAPKFSNDAIMYIQSKKTKTGLRLIEIGEFKKDKDEFDLRPIPGGLLMQTKDTSLFITKTIEELFCEPKKIKDEISQKELLVGIVTKKQPDKKSAKLFEFAYRVCKHAKSNAVVICREYSPGFYQLLGLGAGQPNRNYSANRLAVPRAYDNLKIEYKIMKGKANDAEKAILKTDLALLKKTGKNKDSEAVFIKKQLTLSVAASDAFFPFPDGVISLAKAGIGNIISPGGSLHDSEVIDTSNKLGITMIFSGRRHFNH